MNSFQLWCIGIVEHDRDLQAIQEREAILTKIYSKEQMAARWEKMGYRPPEQKTVQLELF